MLLPLAGSNVVGAVATATAMVLFPATMPEAALVVVCAEPLVADDEPPTAPLEDDAEPLAASLVAEELFDAVECELLLHAAKTKAAAAVPATAAMRVR